MTAPRGAGALTYALVTPARNEEQFIERTLQSMVRQTKLPIRWVIVSDGSTDATDDIVRGYARRYRWIDLLRVESGDGRDFARKVQAFNAGYAQLRDLPYDIIGNLDADLSFGEELFAALLERFAQIPDLGVAGAAFLQEGALYDFRFSSINHVSGSCQLFRRACFEAIGGYVPIAHGGVDWIAVTSARMKGWKTRTFVEHPSVHHRDLGSVGRRPWEIWFRRGQQDYALGSHPLWQVARSVYQSASRPYVVRGLLLLSGYTHQALTRARRPIPPEMVRFHRAEQMARLKRIARGLLPHRTEAAQPSAPARSKARETSSEPVHISVCDHGMRPPRPHLRRGGHRPVRPTWLTRLAKLTILTAATAFTLLLCDLSARLIVNPVDVLTPTLVLDDVLGFRIVGGSSGHDAWGFRNRSVPATVDIVALGDSITYGNRATLDDSWPSVLARLSGKSVYNFGIGGYGPNQYYHLLQTRALGLKPRIVICGVSLVDDFTAAFGTTYGMDYWASLRAEGVEPISAPSWGQAHAGHLAWHKRFRNWLSRNSMLYRLVGHGLLQSIKGRYQIENASWLYENTTSLILPEKRVREAFVPTGGWYGLDQESPRVREGLRLTVRILRDMNALCAREGVQFVVAVMPTKESVFARYLEQNPTIPMNDILDRLIANERLARRTLFAELGAAGIRYVDLLPALEAASEVEPIYVESATDIHPNRNGYRVIAEALAQYLAANPH